VTTAEALASGLPMILTYPIPGPEERHVRYLRENGLALYAETLAEVPRLATRLLSSAGELSEIRRRSREWSRPDASHAVAQVAVALLEKATYIDLLATRPQRSGESVYLM
jgi:processive 1,2-diacylglycerol beta-glucosyltransferase